MKRFTKIALGIAGFFFGVAAICLVAAFAMGVTLADVQMMIRDGRFSFGPEDGVHIQLWGDEDIDLSDGDHEETFSSDTDTEREIPHKCTQLYVELEAGEINISYGDVEFIQIKQRNIPGFAITADDASESVHIRGELDIVNNSGMELTIVLPKDVKFEVVELKVGASQANVRDIIAEQMTFEVGTGQANISNLSVEEFEIEVGAGEAIVKNLSVRELDVEAGVGKVDIEIAGAEVDYNYDVECGIGEVVVGNRSFGGMGTSQKITNIGAQHHMDIDCGIGEINMHFTCDTADGTCGDSSHNHNKHNSHKGHE